MTKPSTILRSNLWISLSASCITAYFSMGFGASYDLNLVWIILNAFLSTFAIYTFYRLKDRILLWIIPAVLSLLISFTSSALNSVIAINLILCLLYQSPFSKHPLRKNPWIKPLLIAACWVNTIWLAPLLQYAVPVWESMSRSFTNDSISGIDTVALFMQTQWKASITNGIAIFCLYYALCLLTDLNQLKEDQKNGFTSFPIKYGPKTTFATALLLLLPLACFTIIRFPYSLFMLDTWAAVMWTLVSGIVTLVVYYNPNKRINAFLADNIIGLCALILLILQVINRG